MPIDSYAVPDELKKHYSPASVPTIKSVHTMPDCTMRVRYDFCFNPWCDFWGRGVNGWELISSKIEE